MSRRLRLPDHCVENPLGRLVSHAVKPGARSPRLVLYPPPSSSYPAALPFSVNLILRPPTRDRRLPAIETLAFRNRMPSTFPVKPPLSNHLVPITIECPLRFFALSTTLCSENGIVNCSCGQVVCTLPSVFTFGFHSSLLCRLSEKIEHKSLQRSRSLPNASDCTRKGCALKSRALGDNAHPRDFEVSQGPGFIFVRCSFES
jgi:hypothetical protein